ncbi:hypothetical protein SAMN05660865_00259 [Caloramator fervidus]|uniref:PASTA domain-containing protein n=1 Tax=Caloramator fervidus TaxID=29344 RepID=A0A1H5S3N8_9CLOT|nr:hypothetical protein SAMN05660865_00259 [Caloramator fervidus]
MDVRKFLGFDLEKVEEMLKKHNVKYRICYLLSPKGKKLGEEKKVIKIEEKDDEFIIYVSYF